MQSQLRRVVENIFWLCDTPLIRKIVRGQAFVSLGFFTTFRNPQSCLTR